MNLFLILLRLRTHWEEGKPIKIKWYHDKDDEEIQEIGEDFIELITIPFEIISVSLKHLVINS